MPNSVETKLAYSELSSARRKAFAQILVDEGKECLLQVLDGCPAAAAIVHCGDKSSVYSNLSWADLFGHTDTTESDDFDIFKCFVEPDQVRKLIDGADFLCNIQSERVVLQTINGARFPGRMSLTRIREMDAPYVLVWAHRDNSAAREVLPGELDGETSHDLLENAVSHSDSEAKFQALVQASPLCIHEIGLDGKLMSMNPAGLRMMGASNECEIVGLQYTDIPIDDDQRRVSDLFERALSGEGTTFDFAVQGDNGILHFSSCFAPIVDSNGNVTKLMGVSQDISNRVRREEQLRDYSEMFEQWKSSNFIGILLSDENGRIMEVNDTFLAMLGFTQEEFLDGRFDWKLLTPSEFSGLDSKAIDEATEKGFWTPFEKEFIHKAGHRVPIIIGGSRYREDPNEYIVFVVDISTQKKAEQDLLTALEDAKQASNAKSQFLTSMSHELRTPLNAILGFAQVLESDCENPLTSTQIEQLHHISDGGTILLELVNQILDLARIEADLIDVSYEVVNASQMVSSCVSLTAGLGAGRDITVSNRFGHQSDITLYTDELKLKQCLINLISNAVKYNRDGGTVILDGYETDEGFLKLTVTDTGLGIDSKDSSEIFQMFHRVGAKMTVDHGSAGVGLSVAKSLVEKMSGRIGFESELGVGSVFWIEMPLTPNSIERAELAGPN